jgi:hypothetical protein
MAGALADGRQPQPQGSDWRAAGVLPYAIVDGEVLCLLGQEYIERGSTRSLLLPPKVLPPQPGDALPSPPPGPPRYRSWWSDFGGGREPSDVDAAHTAAREWAEETLGLWGDGTALPARVHSSTTVMRRRLSGGSGGSGQGWGAGLPLRGGSVLAVSHESYVMYCVECTYIDSLMFQLARDENDNDLLTAAAAAAPTNAGRGAARTEAAAAPASAGATTGMSRRCGEKRDFAWVSLRQLGRAGQAGRLRLRAVDGAKVTLLPRLAFALRAAAPHLLSRVSGARPQQQALEWLRVPPPPAGRCLYLSSDASEPGALLEAVVAGACALVGEGLEKATLFRRGRRSVFALVVFCRAADAACLHRWINHGGGGGGGAAGCGSSTGTGEPPPAAIVNPAAGAATAAAIAAAERVFAEYAFFTAAEPAEGGGGSSSSSSGEGSGDLGSSTGTGSTRAAAAASGAAAAIQQQGRGSGSGSGRGSGSSGQASSLQQQGSTSRYYRKHSRPRSAKAERMSAIGRKRLLGVRRASNACTTISSCIPRSSSIS